MTGVPLPISHADIDRYLSAVPIMIDRLEFDAAILALDDAWRDEWSKEQSKKTK